MAGGRDVLNDYPVQPAKVQRPALRDETLARDRLLDWLAAKIHHRVVFVIAEAGYGKTTLLADFSRRTRVRTLWYRLDEEDRNWIAFVSYLIAAGREHDADFAPITAGMLREIGPSGPSRQAIVETFIRELRSLGEHGAVVILDDFHVVDDEPEVRDIVGELIARAPERVSFVVLSRRVPSVRVARLRALGEVAELATDDLRFNGAETERLFRETYGQPLDGDVLEDLSQRTEGWAASLQLVQAAIRDRSPTETRRFIRSLSGAEGDLYDYLAEEVVGDLPEELQDFLMKASILQSLGGTGLQDVSGLDEKRTTSLLAQAERVGLLGRPHRGSTERRFHPLVRQFLSDRLLREAGHAGVRSLHLRVAEAARQSEWQTAAHHYRVASDLAALRTLLLEHLPTIVATGGYSAAQEFVAILEDDPEAKRLHIVPSRVAQQRGEIDQAVAEGLIALDAPSTDGLEALALGNLLHLQAIQGNVGALREVASRMLDGGAGSELATIARATLGIIDISVGPMQPFLAQLETMAAAQRSSGHKHYLGVTMLNLAEIHRHSGDWRSARTMANAAIDALVEASDTSELGSAYGTRAWTYAHEGNWDQARADLDQAAATSEGVWHYEAKSDELNYVGMYHDPADALRLGTETDLDGLPPVIALWTLIGQARARTQARQFDEAARLLAKVPRGESTMAAHASILACTAAFLAAVEGSDHARDLAQDAFEVAVSQGAHFWRKVASVLVAAADPDPRFGDALGPMLVSEPGYLSIVCEVVVPRLHQVVRDFDLLTAEVERRPERWRAALRREAQLSESAAQLPAAKLLDLVGERSDVSLLRNIARRHRKGGGFEGLGRGLARRRADKVYVVDLGRVEIHRGDTVLAGTSVRRRVLGLLCLVLSQPSMSTTREFVMEALWPDLDPSAALNSLNQTIYFLRRVIEPSYNEATSPGYLHHEGELIWLDDDLVSSRANECRTLIETLSGTPTVQQVDALSERYTGRFALDFEYEDWAVPYREWLHASYLETIEQAVREDSKSAHFERAIRLARRGLLIDPGAEQLELLLLRVYRLSGAHAAAAEQYEHYASVLRNELGVEPPPLDAL